jgi:hypothetical protein
MIIRNYTPFVPIFFESRDVRGREFCVFVLRGTFGVVPDGTIRPHPKQSPLIKADLYHGELNGSSLYMESDLAPFKPKADIHINAVACTRGRRALPDWQIRLRVGVLEKTLRVTGPRQWVRQRGRYQLTEPEPSLEVPIRYERAFGGIWTTNWGRVCRFEENPVGVGYIGEEMHLYPDRILAPQIESPDDPIRELGEVHYPQGLGPIARSWQPRLKLAGTFDEAWKRNRWPDLPEDFNPEHYNSAHPDLIYPGYLRGDEEVELDGLHPDGRLQFFLPKYQIGLLLRMENGSITMVNAAIDTLFIDVPDSRVYIIWRAAFREQKPIRALEARMLLPSGGNDVAK